MTRVWSAALQGVHGAPIEVEVRISSQLPRVDIVGLPEAAVRESVSRIRGAIAATGRTFPDRRVTVNLAPAELRKSGAGLDLPIALGILAASEVLPRDALVDRAFIGELALDGRLRETRGTLAAVLAARELGMREAIVPASSLDHARYAPGIRVLGASDLSQVLSHLAGEEPLATRSTSAPRPACVPPDEARPCLSDIRGQEHAKRALEVAAAGGHGLLLMGPPGTGKTLLAQRLPDLLPPLDDGEELEAICVLDACDLRLSEERRPGEVPFRAPHHTASAAGLLGGGNPIRPGEVSLAHRGVLFLDELAEFDRRCLESMREVMEQGVVRISRANVRCEMPARFQLVAASNPCPCGYYGEPDRDCRCDDAALARYRKRLSGPLLDRIDLTIRIGRVPWDVLRRPANGPSTNEVRERVMSARERQRARGVRCNAAIPDSSLDRLVKADDAGLELLGRAVESLHLSARGTRRILRVARTIADLDHRESTPCEAIAEALHMRQPSTD